ncbi:MAG: ribonuclease HI [Candidatus Sericytochromatia bacterium]
MKKIFVYTDGSAINNPGPGGYCGILKYGNHEKIVKGGESETTNNRMELIAVIESFRHLKEPCEIELVSDSTYVIKGISEWLEGWIKKSFRNVKNPELWQEYVKVSKGHKISCTWVRGHDGHEFNEKCDKIARDEAIKQLNAIT